MNTKNAGFTLIELAAALTCLGIILSAAALSFSNSERHSLKMALTELKSDLSYAKRLSLNGNVKTRVIFDLDLNLYKIQSDSVSGYTTVKLTELENLSIDSVNTNDLIIEYTQRGTTGSACTIEMSSVNYKGSLTVNIGSGRVKIMEIVKKQRF